MIPLIRDEMVKRGWMTDEELPDIIALAQSAPGVLAVNMSDHPGDRNGLFRLPGQSGGGQDIQRHTSRGRVADCRSDDQDGSEEQRDLVGMGNHSRSDGRGSIPADLADLDPAGPSCDRHGRQHIQGKEVPQWLRLNFTCSSSGCSSS